MWAWLRAAWAWFLDGHAHPAGIAGVVRNAKRGVLSWVGGSALCTPRSLCRRCAAPQETPTALPSGLGLLLPWGEVQRAGGVPEWRGGPSAVRGFLQRRLSRAMAGSGGRQ